MAIEIRPVTPEEHVEAGEVTALAYREFAREDDPDWEAYLDHLADVAGRAERSLVLVAVENGRILGTATLELGQRIDDDDPPLADDEAHVRMLGVHPEARGRRIGRMLMEALIEEARARARTLVTLATTRRMEVARRMYESMGFVRGEDSVFPDGFVLLTYSLRISLTAPAWPLRPHRS
ncbi:MAG: GNAT family N-acetyltransferase [Actinobacteria bacterium]|nr:GNAT family N-acetyltransferase [Actinomycetota bacterium]